MVYICNLQDSSSNIECYGNFDFFILLFLFYIRSIRYYHMEIFSKIRESKNVKICATFFSF